MLSVEQMKWWGWGGENIDFIISDKPELWSYIKKVVGIDGEPTYTPPIKFEDIELSLQILNEKFINENYTK